MIRKYKYEYDYGTAGVEFEFDDEKIDFDLAKELYNFFSWSTIDEPEGDVLDKLAFQYAKVAIRFATANEHNTFGVKSDFEDGEGLPSMDGEHGYKLISVYGIDLRDIEIELV